MAEEAEPQGEVEPKEEAESQDADQEAPPSESPDEPQKAGPAQVIGCWAALLAVAVLVVAGAFLIGRLSGRFLRRVASRPDTTMEEVEQRGIGDGNLEAGEAYKNSVQLEFVSMAPMAPAPEPEDEEEETTADEPKPEDKTPPAAPDEAARPSAGGEDAEEEPAEVVREGETVWIVSAKAANTGDRTVTYLKVQVTLTDESGSDLGGSWVDAATALETSIYIRYFGDIPPGKVKEFEAHVWVPEDSKPDKVALDVTKCAVK